MDSVTLSRSFLFISFPFVPVLHDRDVVYIHGFVLRGLLGCVFVFIDLETTSRASGLVAFLGLKVIDISVMSAYLGVEYST